MTRRNATYPLELIQKKVLSGKGWVVTEKGLQTAAALGFDVDDIAECILALDEGDFYKTMASVKHAGKMQDVYLPTYEGVPVYLKLQDCGTAVVISFKKDTSR